MQLGVLQNYEKETLRHETNEARFIAKQNYHSKLSQKLIDPKTSCKQYWHIQKELYGSKIQRNPSIIKNTVVYTSPIAKCNIFNKTFTNQTKLPD